MPISGSVSAASAKMLRGKPFHNHSRGIGVELRLATVSKNRDAARAKGQAERINQAWRQGKAAIIPGINDHCYLLLCAVCILNGQIERGFRESIDNADNHSASCFAARRDPPMRRVAGRPTRISQICASG